RGSASTPTVMPASTSVRRRAASYSPMTSSRRGRKRGSAGIFSAVVPGSSVAAVFLDHFLVEFNAETGAVGDLHHAIADRRPVDPHQLPDRIACGIGKTLGIGAVGHRG